MRIGRLDVGFLKRYDPETRELRLPRMRDWLTYFRTVGPCGCKILQMGDECLSAWEESGRAD